MNAYDKKPRLERRLVTAILAPLLLAGVLAVTVLSGARYLHEQDNFNQRIEVLSDAYSRVLGADIWNIARDDLTKTARLLINEPEVTGVQISDDTGKILVSLGDTLAPSPLHRDIFFTTDVDRHFVGTFVLFKANDLVTLNLINGILQDLLLVSLLVVALFLAIQSVTRKIIGKPLAKFHQAIAQNQLSDHPTFIEWQSDDEFGDLIKAYNQQSSSRAAALKALSESEERQRALTSSAPDAIITASLDGIIVEWNTSATNLTGWQRNEAINRVWKMFRMRDCDTCQLVNCAELIHIIEQDRDSTIVLADVLTKENTFRPVEISIARWTSQGRHFTTLILRDVSEKIAAETKRVILEKELRQAQKLEAIGQLAGGIAHEINTPSQYIADNLRFLRDSWQDLSPAFEALITHAQQTASPTAQQALDDIKDADWDFLKTEIPDAILQSLSGVEQIAGIVVAMKEFSHPSQKQFHRLDLNRAIENAVTISKNAWKLVATVKTELQPAIEHCNCLGGEINQVLLNLIVNASHAIEASKKDELGEITISTQQIEDHLEIRVQDNGCGIPVDIQSKIFDPFFTTKEVGKGTGQGLSIAWDTVVNKHGGTLNFTSESGVGTTFIMTLPIDHQVQTH